jgi:3-methyladenine DNA glycosylase AlkC
MILHDNPNAFKNRINHDLVKIIAAEIGSVLTSFNQKEFCKVIAVLAPLGLKERVLVIARELRVHLPSDYNKAISVLVKVMNRDKLSGFALWPFSEFIAQNGLDHFDQSMQAMHLLTQKFTAEFAIRPFFLKDADKVLNYFKQYALDENHHVRRWVSEGSRPLLPWGLRLPVFVENPDLTITLLDILKLDEELYVRKSVANHLNDISKHHPLVVVETIRRWEKNCPAQHSEKLAWIKRQALRTLIKKGYPAALKLIGVSGETKIKISLIKLQKERVSIGDKLEFSFDVTSQAKKEQKLVIDYLVHFVKSNGKLSHKVYKLKTCSIKAGQKISFSKSHSLKPITTMKWYRGEHKLSIQVNGKIYANKDWFFAI